MLEFGYSAFLTALILTGVCAGMGVGRKRPETFHWKLRFLKITSAFLVFLLAIALGTVMYAFVVGDISLKIVLFHSHALEPLAYRLSALWGSAEGSLLLWVFVLSGYICAFAFVPAVQPFEQERVWALSILSGLLGLFLGIMVWAANPFTRLAVQGLQGVGMNPILQDPMMTLHPPALYLGYVGFAIPYALSLGILRGGNFTKQHAVWLQTWSLIAWIFLTLGILSGSFWAYFELGWGGWWFWDPVENASLMPWLAATALLHALRAYQKTGSLKMTSLFLGLLTFVFCAVGTYLTRSGIVLSVHSFSNEGRQGFLLGSLVGGISVLSLGTFLARVSRMKADASCLKTPGSFLGSLHIYGGLLALLLVLGGTVGPLLFKGHEDGAQGILSPEYFNATLVPLGVIALLLMAFVPFYQKKTQKITALLKENLLPLNGALAVFLGLLYRPSLPSVVGALALAGATLVLLMTLKKVFIRGQGVRKIIRRDYAMMLAHGGFALCVGGMSLDTLFKEEMGVFLGVQESVSFQGYELTLAKLAFSQHPLYVAEKGYILLKDSQGRALSVLIPEKKVYEVRGSLRTLTAVYRRFLSHIYVVLGPTLPNAKRALYLFYHPFVLLIWIGGLVMAGGGAWALAETLLARRRRVQK